jgi:hypothetical protein
LAGSENPKTKQIKRGAAAKPTHCAKEKAFKPWPRQCELRFLKLNSVF